MCVCVCDTVAIVFRRHSNTDEKVSSGNTDNLTAAKIAVSYTETEIRSFVSC